MLHTLNEYYVTCQLHLNKAGKKEKENLASATVWPHPDPAASSRV